jgi:hypothetical protein
MMCGCIERLEPIYATVVHDSILLVIHARVPLVRVTEERNLKIDRVPWIEDPGHMGWWLFVSH